MPKPIEEAGSVQLRFIVDEQWTASDFETLLEVMQDLYRSYAAIYSEPHSISVSRGKSGWQIHGKKTVSETIQPLRVVGVRYASLGEVLLQGLPALIVASAVVARIAILAGIEFEKKQNEVREGEYRVMTAAANASRADENARHEAEMNRLEEDLARAQLDAARVSNKPSGLDPTVRLATPMAEVIQKDKRSSQIRIGRAARAAIQGSEQHADLVRKIASKEAPAEVIVSRLVTAPAARLGVLAHDGKIRKVELLVDGEVVDTVGLGSGRE